MAKHREAADESATDIASWAITLLLASSIWQLRDAAMGAAPAEILRDCCHRKMLFRR